uniref:Methyltransferase n=1 Tax=viral metagenome TaxID=1070528 RepID=A0A6C0JRB7_9ZZZZ
MTLLQLVNNWKTDKNTAHSYLGLYENLLNKKKHTAKTILEIGIGDFGEKNGGSIKLWRDYFPAATVYGLDILPMARVMDEIQGDPRIVLYTETDAYDEDTFNRLFYGPESKHNLKCDFMLDDGPHKIETNKKFITMYSKILADDGILIIEDLQSIDWLEELAEATPDHLKPYIRFYDLRGIKGRYDDIVFVIDKSGNNSI